jgi:competence protein ComEC
MGAFIGGCLLGMALMSGHPSGLDSRYGIALLVLALLLVVPAFTAYSPRTQSQASAPVEAVTGVAGTTGVGGVWWVCILLMAVLAGCGRTLLIHPPVGPADLAFYNDSVPGQQVVITGRVSGEPVNTDRAQRIRLAAEYLKLPGETAPRRVRGQAYVVLGRYPQFSVGQRLALSGTLTAPPSFEGFDFGAYLARQGIYSYMTFPRIASTGPDQIETNTPEHTLAEVRSTVRDALRRVIPEPQAALAVGVVTGDRSSLPDAVEEAFRRSGTTHVLAISGQNIALLVGVIWLLYGGISRARGRMLMRRMPLWLFVPVLALLAVYTVFTGASPSVVRAAMMGAVLLAAPLVGRRYDPVAAVAVTASAMALFDPDVLADAGFQLSFGGMMGIAVVAPHIYRLLTFLHLPAALAAPVSAALGAQAVTAPLTALLWGQISLVGLPATLTVEVALLPLMVTGILSALPGIWLPPVGSAFGWLTWLSAGWVLWWAQLWAAMPWASVPLEPVHPAWVLLYYCVLAMVIWAPRRVRIRIRDRWWQSRAPGRYAPVLMLIMSAVAICLWIALLTLVLG